MVGAAKNKTNYKLIANETIKMTSKKLLIAGIAVFLAVGMVMSVSPARAADADDYAGMTKEELIELLLALLTGDDGDDEGATGDVPDACDGITFERSLGIGSTGDDVKCLQALLNSDCGELDGIEVNSAGAVGSAGHETSYYGSLTSAAVVEFQEVYMEDVLGPWNLTSGTGYFGSTSRAKANEVLTACAAEEPEGPEEPETCPDYTTSSTCEDAGCYWYSSACHATEEPAEPAAEGLTVALANDTPVSAIVADNANANFTKLILTAGDADVTISKLYITRTGNTVNSDMENLKIVDMDGVFYGSIGSLNTNSKALITFIPALVIEANTSESYYLRGGFPNGTTGGRTAALGIASADDIYAGDAVVSGSFPMAGNYMTVVDLTIGTATFAEDGTTVDAQPDVGDTGVVVNQFKVTASSTEAITIEQITAMEYGTASLLDTANIELYSVTNGESLGIVENWNAEGKATWTGLDLVVAKGKKHRFQIRLDIIDGAGLAVNADIEDGTDMLASVRGNSYGYYITATHSGDGKGASDQNIQAGSLVVAKSSSTPATGGIAPSDDQEITVFDFTARGEEVMVSALLLDLDYTTLVTADVTSVRIYDEDGEIVCGPQDPVVVSGDVTSGTVSFTDTFVVPTGTHEYSVVVNMKSDCQTGEAVQIGIDDPHDDITAKGMSSNDSIYPTPDGTAVGGNTMTIGAGALTAVTIGTPSARNLAKGTTDFLWSTVSLNAYTSGEDMLVTSITVKDDVTDGTYDAGDFDNVEIWADLNGTSGDSVRGDAYETLVSQSKQMVDTAAATQTLAFSLTQSVRVPKGSYVRIGIVGDLATDATATETHAISVSSVTASGADTGESPTVTCTETSAQDMTVQDEGSLTVTVDSSSASASMILDQTLADLATFRLAADDVEDLDLYSFKVTLADGSEAVDTLYWYYNGEVIQSATGAADATVYFGAGTVVIPADDYVLVTVKALMKNINSSVAASCVVCNDAGVQATIVGGSDIVTKGKSTGASVAGGTATGTAAHVLYESYPVVTVSTSPASPSGTLVNGADTSLAIFDIESAGNKDLYFDNSVSSLFAIQVTVMGDNTDSATENIYLKDADGNTLATGTITSATGTSQITFAFDGHAAGFTVPAGQTKKLYVTGDTTDLEDGGDIIQVWLEAVDVDCTFGVNGYDNYEAGTKVFKGNILGGTLTNPRPS